MSGNPAGGPGSGPSRYEDPERGTPGSETPRYEVFAVKYAEREGTRNASFLFKDPHDGPLAMDYFVWAIVGGNRAIIVDLGFDRRYRRGARHLLRTPAEGLSALGLETSGIGDVIVTHLHYDHCGSLPDFPAARIHLQDAEMTFATGRFLKWKAFRYGNFVEYTVDFVRAVHDGRVAFAGEGTAVAPGVVLHRVGGHTHGMQVARVWTRKGWLVLASDAVHMYANMEMPNPYPAVFDVGAMLEGFRTLRRLAGGREDMIIPGHDPLVMQRYPAAGKGLDGIAVRLD